MKRIYTLSGRRHFVLKAIKSQRHETLILYIYIYIYIYIYEKLRHILLDSISMDQSSSWETNRFLVKFPAFYRTRSFNTAFTTILHLSLPSTTSIHPMPPCHVLHISFNLILPYKPRSSKWPLYLTFLHQNFAYNPTLTYHMPGPSHLG